MNKNNSLGRIAAVLLVLAIAAGAAAGIWLDAQPQFRDVTISAGDEMPQLQDYLTEYAVAQKCAIVTDLSGLDSTCVGEHQVVLRSGAREQTVTLRIVDTTAPELEVQDLELPLGSELRIEDLVTHVWDHTQVTVSYVQEPQITEDYSDLTVEIMAVDTSGNTTVATSSVSFIWMRPEFVLEYGNLLTREDLLYTEEMAAELVTDEDLERINAAPVGEYILTSTLGNRTQECRITIQDTVPPVLELKEVQVFLGKRVKLKDFVVSATDASGDVTLTMLTTPDTSVKGTQTIVIEARDVNGNVTTAETTLYVVTDVTPPIISGVSKTMNVEKNSTPDFMEGVSGYDGTDGKVEVTVDSSRVALDTAGTYFLVYTARDSSGNVATVRRKVVVIHDAEDTAKLVENIAGTLSNDPETIRDYVRKSISYSSSWGGDDPIWMGFTEKHGNCYVHALCLKAILDLKGWNTQLIWVTNKTHYWLVIEIEEGVWRHIDATPSNTHSRYSLMTDDERHWTLSGRNWDRSKWPACE